MRSGQNYKQYSRIKHALAFAGIAVPVLFLTAVLFSGLSLELRNFAAGISDNFYLNIVLYLLILGAAYYILTFPLGFYSGFILEHKFNLSSQKFNAWLWDEIKEILVSLTIFLPLSLGMYFLLRNFSGTWWIIAGVFWIFFSIILSKIAPVVLLPIFFKQKPLEDEELKQRLLKLAERAGTNIKGVFELDLSRKTKKANAALTGIGNTRRILLGDALLKDYTKDEIELVMAHELGHQKLLHIWKLLGVSVIVTFLGLYIASVVIKSGANVLSAGGAFANLYGGGFNGISDIAAFPVIALAISLFGIAAMPIENGYSRHLERNADMFALKITGMPEAFISAMSKLSKQNLSDPEPSKFIEIMLYNHPPIAKRIKMAQGFLSEARGLS
ncbi:MAG: M48 family metallopeptidase [Candidatus Omnitrophota bacterium]